jgi:hypothetical protein
MPHFPLAIWAVLNALGAVSQKCDLCDSWKYNPDITEELDQSAGFRRQVYVQGPLWEEVLDSPFDTLVVSFGRYRNWTVPDKHSSTWMKLSAEEKADNDHRMKHVDPFKPYVHFRHLGLQKSVVEKIRKTKPHAKLLLSLGGGDNGDTGKIMPRVFTKLYRMWQNESKCYTERDKCDSGALDRANETIIYRWAQVMTEFIQGKQTIPWGKKPGATRTRKRTHPGVGWEFDGECKIKCRLVDWGSW